MGYIYILYIYKFFPSHRGMCVSFSFSLAPTFDGVGDKNRKEDYTRVCSFFWKIYVHI